MTLHFSVCRFCLEKLFWPGKLSTYSESRGESFSSVWSKLLKFLLSCASIKYYPDLWFSLSTSKAWSLLKLGSNFKNWCAGWAWSKGVPAPPPRSTLPGRSQKCHQLCCPLCTLQAARLLIRASSSSWVSTYTWQRDVLFPCWRELRTRDKKWGATS